jgi:hypothetical protein
MTQTCETPPGMAGLAKSVPGGNTRETGPNSVPNQAEILRKKSTPIAPGETPSRQSWRWKSYCSVATRTS